jgi:hypothetical protein
MASALPDAVKAILFENAAKRPRRKVGAVYATSTSTCVTSFNEVLACLFDRRAFAGNIVLRA